MKLRVLNPGIFQGNTRSNHYFEGWYYKNVSGDMSEVLSFIPGISLNGKDRHSFIQIINGLTGETQYITYSIDELTWSRESLIVTIGESVFTDKYIDLRINNGNCRISGRLDFSECINYPKSLFSPGIMGWYSFVPLMECKHAIISANHFIEGSLDFSGRQLSFTGGKGYIEKDWGTSFPESWLWMQANNFDDRNMSLSFSVAKIPWLGSYFIGFISFLYINGEFKMFSTYNKSKIEELTTDGNIITATVSNTHYRLKISVSGSSTGELRAPVAGSMTRRIRESIDSNIDIEFRNKDNSLIYKGNSKRAGLEVIDRIFDYFK